MRRKKIGAIRNGRRMEMNFLSFREWSRWEGSRKVGLVIGDAITWPRLLARSLRYLRNVFDEGEISCHVETLFRSVI